MCAHKNQCEQMCENFGFLFHAAVTVFLFLSISFCSVKFEFVNNFLCHFQLEAFQFQSVSKARAAVSPLSHPIAMISFTCMIVLLDLNRHAKPQRPLQLWWSLLFPLKPVTIRADLRVHIWVAGVKCRIKNRVKK